MPVPAAPGRLFISLVRSLEANRPGGGNMEGPTDARLISRKGFDSRGGRGRSMIDVLRSIG